ncbi:enoyl-CoA hydratase/isomerase family protein [Dactylosporangium roseum]|uniref:Enoyl-CoA hydratase/isomerase family protein n=1 Tax=Dactylosporangium roseum TaxID=47989 RepID=A0ABY5YXD7_9ACTN|nr:enoyl-CoA hydratase/isomerase family protein [Dactylosporangium roseum]UWZ34415.1 enoyl-CoA hydratase/isomerase family protein [Dactylosporangium roseum]
MRPWEAPAALADRLATPLLDQDGQLTDPLLVVDLDAGPIPEPPFQVPSPSDRILLGVTRHNRPVPALRPLLEALDLIICPSGAGESHRALVGVPSPVSAAAALHAAATAHPTAATTLAGLLRWAPELPVPIGLDAESLAYSTLLGGAEFQQWLARRGPRPPRPPAGDPPVLVERIGDALRITLHRPERRNAYGREVRDALVAALRIADVDAGVERIVLDGAGPSFCSGGDLDEFGTAPDLATAHLIRTRAGAGRLLHRLADRTEVRLHGFCVGAGIELPAFAGRVVAAPDTRIRLPEIGMGLIPGAGGTVSIPRRIGRWRALYLALSGDTLDARTALSWGLVDEVTAG